MHKEPQGLVGSARGPQAVAGPSGVPAVANTQRDLSSCSRWGTLHISSQLDLDGGDSGACRDFEGWAHRRSGLSCPSRVMSGRDSKINRRSSGDNDVNLIVVVGIVFCLLEKRNMMGGGEGEIISGSLITNNDEVKVLTSTSPSISIGLEVRSAV